MSDGAIPINDGDFDTGTDGEPEFDTFSKPVPSKHDVQTDPELIRLAGLYNGIFTADQIDDEKYFKIRRLSKSSLDKIARSPLHYEWQVIKGNWPHPTPGMSLGSATHCAVLQRDLFLKKYVARPKFDRRTKAGKANAAAFDADVVQRGMIPIGIDQWQTAVDIGDAIATQHPWVAELLSLGGDSEVAVLWTDSYTATRCKGKLDFLSSDRKIVIDLKNTTDTRNFSRTVAEHRYHVQQAFYTDGLKENDADLDLFLFVAVEPTPPYLVQLFQLDAASVAQGREEYHEDIALLGNCLVNNCWPGIADVTTIGLPRWAMTVPTRR
jgi:hypothetical protein